MDIFDMSFIRETTRRSIIGDIKEAMEKVKEARKSGSDFDWLDLKCNLKRELYEIVDDLVVDL